MKFQSVKCPFFSQSKFMTTLSQIVLQVQFLANRKKMTENT